MSATLDGARWDATVAIGVTNRPPSAGVEGILAVHGVGSALSVGFVVAYNGPGTYTYASTDGIAFHVSTPQGDQAWVADPSVQTGGNGVLTLSTITANRATGTFSFAAPASLASRATGTRAVASGVFDVTF